MKYLNYFKSFEDFKKKDLPEINKNMALEYDKAMNIMSLEETVKFVADNCKEFIERPILIHRTMGTAKANFFWSEPIRRVSRDCPNWYTLMMDNSKEWEGYPERGKSFICTLGDNESLGAYYYIVIPNDNSKWGLANVDDIYSCFYNYLGSGPDDFFEFLNYYSNELGLGGISDESYPEMIKDINKLEENITGNNLEKSHFVIQNFIKVNDYHNLVRKIKTAMEPEKNGFTLKKYTELKQSQIHRECWTNSPCVFIKWGARGQNFENFINKLALYTGKNIKTRIWFLSH